MTRPTYILLVTLLACATAAHAQQGRRAPQIGYVYPAGARQDSVVQIVVGGQGLRGASDAYVTGDGVQVKVIEHYGSLRGIDQEQRQALARRMRELAMQRWAEAYAEGKVSQETPWGALVPPGGRRMMADGDSTMTEEVELPKHPLLNNLEDKSLRELQNIRCCLFDIERRQLNPQLEETVLLEVKVARGAEPGKRELRLATQVGLTNAMVFEVGVLPEVRELEQNDPGIYNPLPPEPPLDLPVVINGQILPGDVDHFTFNAKQGQQLVIEAQARALIPYLADAVPGWFQATLVVYDPAGKEVAYADDYRFDPDPVLLFEVPADGEYAVEIRDSIYRGRDDFVYRLSIAEQPFITQVFPLGARAGRAKSSEVEGWNLRSRRLALNTHAGGEEVREATLGQGRKISNPVPYAVDTLPESSEEESNDTIADAQRLHLPRIVNGCISAAGDVDVFWFDGKAGDEIVVDVLARRLHSPLDSLVRLMNASGDVLAWNDDYEHKDGYLHQDMGLLTHHADSYLTTVLPADGKYYVQVSDAQDHGDAAYAYRVRIGPPRPDFALRATPSSITVPAGRYAPLCVYVLRKDGFDDAIEIRLAGAPEGFELQGGRIPVGCDRVRMTLMAPPKVLDGPVNLTLDGRALIDGKTVTHEVVPAQDMMQAFLYRHLVPSQEMVVLIRGGRMARGALTLDSATPVRIPAGGETEVRVRMPRVAGLLDLELELDDPPAGVTLADVAIVPGEIAFKLKADHDAIKASLADNLIVEAFMEIARRDRDGKTTGEKQRVSVGVLPAIPIEVVYE
ncbi:MAG: PPC domain-containing protein [Phycisphaerae bacterium]|nr:PPC domain-containing protein [Phycisphaerae bacterium]